MRVRFTTLLRHHREKVQAEVLKQASDAIRPKGEEPRCCDVHAAVWNARNDDADSLAEAAAGINVVWPPPRG
jgi:hypothetical protein